MDKIKKNQLLGWIIIISGLLYLFYASLFIYSLLAERCGILMFWSFWQGAPTLLIAFYKFRIGFAFLRLKLKYLRLMLVLICVLDGIFGYFIQEWMSKAIFTIYLILLYIVPFIYLSLSNPKSTSK